MKDIECNACLCSDRCTILLNNANNISYMCDQEELLRLEEENSKLRQQLEMFSASNIVDSKYAKLASEVVRLQSSVSQVIHLYSTYSSRTLMLMFHHPDRADEDVL